METEYGTMEAHQSVLKLLAAIEAMPKRLDTSSLKRQWGRGSTSAVDFIQLRQLAFGGTFEPH